MNKSDKVKKPMNKLIRRILAAAITVILLGVLIANTNVFTDIKVGSCIGNGSRSMGSLTADTAFQQYFVPQKNDLAYI